MTDGYDGVFDSSHYASTVGEKARRAAQLAGRYYLSAVPRYLAARRRAGLGGWDAGALGSPLRELVRRRYDHHALPPGYPEVLGELHAAGVRITMPRVRLEGLLGVWWTTRDVAGDVIECGAYEGGTALCVAALAARHGLPGRVLLADTFTGIPGAGRHDALRRGGEYGGADLPAAIRARAASLGVADRVELLVGLFADTLPAALADPDRRLSFVHVDANVYEGTRDAVALTLPRLAPGGAMVFDDYNGVLDLGARLAIQEVLAGAGLEPRPLASSSAYVRR